MFNSTFLFSILFVLISFSSGAEKRLPENFKRCSRNDPDVSSCLKVNVADALAKMANGIPDLKVPVLEPLSVSEIDIQTGGGPVTIRQKYSNIKIYGITASNLTSYNADLKHYRLITDSYSPQIGFVGDYVMDGRILLLPIQGKGKCNITISDLVIGHDLVGEAFTKNGKTYIKFKEYGVKFLKFANVKFYFSNLFNGNKALGDQMNKFLNENSHTVFTELKSAYEKSFSIIFKDVSNKIFTKVPFEDIFPEQLPN